MDQRDPANDRRLTVTEAVRPEPYVVASGLTLRYPGSGTPAVDAVSFDAARGEVVTLLGPSGCGKTTALRLLAGLESPDAGSVLVAGRDITDEPPERRKMGFVFQNYALFPHLTVADNVAFGLRVRHAAKSAVTRAVAEALELVGLVGFDKRGVDQLSGGQQQRVAIARALAIEPDVLLMDEPLSNLDTSLREQTREALRELLSRLKITTFFVTHDQSEAFAFSHRIVLMRAGRVVEAGKPELLYRSPEHPFTAEFLGAANLIPATVRTPGKDVDVMGRLLAVGSWVTPTAAAGQPVTLVARGESIRLATSETANALPGRALESIFLGATYQIAVTLDALDVRLRVSSPVDHEPGPVWVIFPTDTLRAIDGSAT